MNRIKGTLTLRGAKEGKEEGNRLFADGRYVLKANPRQGGIASVYRAYDTLDEKTVAIKLFRASHGRDDIVEESFRRETQALSDLRHPNIVQIFDSGIDEETGEQFIAMEWVDQDLSGYCRNSPFDGWAQFYGSVGRSILEAIAFAHTYAIVHRDIKPSNILVTPDGVPKVCDFGISKIRNFLEPGVTLAQYASVPYAPPEPDDGTYSYSRDVFGFGALCLVLLSPEPPRDYQGVHKALDQLAVNEPIRKLLRRALSLDSPAERPATAAVLLGEIDRLSPKRSPIKKGVIALNLTKKIKDVLNFDLGISDEKSIQQFIVSDLTTGRAIFEAPRPPGEGKPPSGPAIRLFGHRYGYIAVPTPPKDDRLLLVSALEYSTSQMEEHRDEAFEVPFDFSFTAPHASVENIRFLQEALTEFGAERKAALVERRRQSIYNTWLNLLNAKTELERQKRRRVNYTNWELSGSAVRFTGLENADAAALDEQDVRVPVTDNLEFTGSVVSVGDDHILVVPSSRNRVEVENIPGAGHLLLDTTKADASLDKQKSALEAVRFGRSVNPSLGSFIVSPAEVPTVHPATVHFLQNDLDEDKKEAVQVAMSRPDLLLIQGPPGTGKTTFITELVLQTLRRDPESRILLTSQTHVALDNSLERIVDRGEGKVEAVRIGHENDERISGGARSLLIDNKLPSLRKSALAQGKQFLETWAAANGVDMTYVKMAMALERLASQRERAEQVDARIAELRPILAEEQRSQLEADARAELDQELDDRIKEREVLWKDIRDSLGSLSEYEKDKETLQHLGRCSAVELRAWAEDYSPKTAQAAQLRRLLAAHSDWESRFGRSREFKAALVASSQVVAGTCLGVMSIPGRQEIEYDLCIVDEASIATPTEVLVPMARARRTILVGDSKQLSPFQDPELQSKGLLQKFNLSKDDQRATLFNHLAEHLPASLKMSLRTQHRMLPAIGNLISECFYDGKLESIPRQPKAYLSALLGKPVVWVSTSKCPNRGSRVVGTSYANDFEVQKVLDLLGRFNFALTNGRDKGRKISVAILTGYSPQKDRLHSFVERKRREWDAFSDIFVNVVDAFQGREADIVIFSVTRSDARGLGFLKELERINVALSRGREYLVIVGDHLFCQEANSRQNPLKDVLDYIRTHPGDCLLEEIEP